VSKGNRYPDAVWICLRELYEASPKASVSAISTALSEMLDITVPSDSAIARRIKKEKWEKLSKKQCKFTSKTLQKKMQKKYNENLTASIDVTDLEEGIEELKNTQLSVSGHGIARLYQEKSFLSRKSANVILDLRRDSYVIGQYHRMLLENLLDVDFKIDNFHEYFFSHPKEFQGMAMDEARSLLHINHARITRSIGLIESMTTSLEKRAKIDFVLYGINPDDTREPESDNRIGDLDDDREYYEEQERLSMQKQEEIAERMALLQSGVFEEQVRLEAQKKAAEHDLGEVIEDGEFEEINE